MKLIPINILSAVIFPFVFSACVSQSSVDFNKQQAAKARVELALGYLQQEDFVQAKLNLDDKTDISTLQKQIQERKRLSSTNKNRI